MPQLREVFWKSAIFWYRWEMKRDRLNPTLAQINFFADCHNHNVNKDCICLYVDRLALKWMLRTKKCGPPCWKRSSIITLRWLATWFKMVPVSITPWVSEMNTALMLNFLDVWFAVISFSVCVTVNQEDDGYTGLHHAAKLGNLEIVKMLLETGQADVNAQVKSQWCRDFRVFRQPLVYY